MTEDFQGLAKILIAMGSTIVAIGVLLFFSDKIPWLGRLPGDFHFKNDHFTFYFPLATSLLISLILSIILWFLKK